MRRTRRWIIWSAGGLASGVFAASAWAQAPVPATGPAPDVPCERPGLLRRAFRHSFNVLQDNWMGYPQEFVEPPPGFYVAETYGIMKAKADPHRFTFYRSDFLDGTSQLSPYGASRFNLMACRVRSWPGPILVEWSPDTPGLAEARRQAVLALLQNVGAPVIPERVVIGPSNYPGMLGTDAANNYNIMIVRDQAAPSNYSLTPVQSATFGAFGGGGAP
jgi:hypothetical protein